MTICNKNRIQCGNIETFWKKECPSGATNKPSYCEQLRQIYYTACKKVDDIVSMATGSGSTSELTGAETETGSSSESETSDTTGTEGTEEETASIIEDGTSDLSGTSGFQLFISNRSDIDPINQFVQVKLV